MSDYEKGVVLYTDGSARPNPGNIGWGCHGYVFEYKDIKKPIMVENNMITNNGYVAHKDIKTLSPAFTNVDKLDKDMYIAVEPISYFDFLGSTLEEGTNNKAEILALSNSIKKVMEYEPKYINVYTDSEYVKNGITDWCKNWDRANWRKPDGTPIINAEQWREAFELISHLKVKGIHFNIEWVRSHSDVFGNTHADILSVIGMNYSTARQTRIEFSVTDAKGYWKNEIDKHPFINFKRIYFNSVEKFNIAGQYFQADPGASDFTVGKRIPETGFAIVKLKENDVAIEAVKQKQFESSNDQNAIIMMKLDRVYSKEIYPYLKEHGKYCLLDSKNNLNINFIDKKPVTVEMNPTGLSLRAIETFNFLEELMNDFLKFKDDGFETAVNTRKLNAHDITNIFFNIEEKKVKSSIVNKYILKDDFTVGFKDFHVTINESYLDSTVKIKIPLILGTDLLPRNNLKKLENESPKVFVITWRESQHSIRYATVIECESGIGIWSNFFADRIFLSNFKE